MKCFQEDKSDYFYSAQKQFDQNLLDKVPDSKQYMDVKRKKSKQIAFGVKRRLGNESSSDEEDQKNIVIKDRNERKFIKLKKGDDGCKSQVFPIY